MRKSAKKILHLAKFVNQASIAAIVFTDNHFPLLLIINFATLA